MGREVVGYTRISRVGGRKGEGFISQADQQEGITARARELGLVIAEWAHDEDSSGGNLQRPEWERVMARILDESDPIHGVIVVRVDRFARTVPEGAPEVKRIWESNRGAGIFVAADLPLDTTTPYGRKMLWDWLSNAELQLEMLKASWWRAKERAIRRGAHIGPTPLAFERIPKNAERDAGKLVPRPEWIPVMRAVFQYAADHPTELEAPIMRWANEHAPRPDGRAWTHTTIANTLRNRIYLGEVAYRPQHDDRRLRADGQPERTRTADRRGDVAGCAARPQPSPPAAVAGSCAARLDLAGTRTLRRLPPHPRPLDRRQQGQAHSGLSV
jgi:DNA invertase Pin-like site-specific DNA recombinase